MGSIAEKQFAVNQLNSALSPSAKLRAPQTPNHHLLVAASSASPICAYQPASNPFSKGKVAAEGPFEGFTMYDHTAVHLTFILS